MDNLERKIEKGSLYKLDKNLKLIELIKIIELQMVQHLLMNIIFTTLIVLKKLSIKLR